MHFRSAEVLAPQHIVYMTIHVNEMIRSYTKIFLALRHIYFVPPLVGFAAIFLAHYFWLWVSTQIVREFSVEYLYSIDLYLRKNFSFCRFYVTPSSHLILEYLFGGLEYLFSFDFDFEN